MSGEALLVGIVLTCIHGQSVPESFAIRTASGAEPLGPLPVDRSIWGGMPVPPVRAAMVYSARRCGTKGKAAGTLKAILYQPGCQIRVLSVNLLSEATRSATFECRPLAIYHAP